jgi:hypothetical protein
MNLGEAKSQNRLRRINIFGKELGARFLRVRELKNISAILIPFFFFFTFFINSCFVQCDKDVNFTWVLTLFLRENVNFGPVQR